VESAIARPFRGRGGELTAMSSRAVGMVVGAAVGAVGRALVTSLHLTAPAQGTVLLLTTAAVAGLLIGVLAGLPGKPLMGAVVGVVVSALLYLGTLPVVMLFHLLGTLVAPSLLEVTAVGALAGVAAGLASQWAARRGRSQTSARHSP
jgi:hypothetical protein